VVARISRFTELAFAPTANRPVIEFVDESLRAHGLSIADFEIFDGDRRIPFGSTQTLGAVMGVLRCVRQRRLIEIQ
jgi:hypothetical protein